MANFKNLKEIYDESFIDREVAAGDEIKAIDLRDRVEVAIWKEAESYLTGVGLPPAAPENADDQQIANANRARNEAVAWAQAVIAGNTQMGLSVFRLMLAHMPGSMSKTDILDMNDAAVQQNIEPVIPLLAYGMHPGR